MCTPPPPPPAPHHNVCCRYFEELFPWLLLACFAFALRHCATDPALQPYLPAALREYPFDATVAACQARPT